LAQEISEFGSFQCGSETTGCTKSKECFEWLSGY